MAASSVTSFKNQDLVLAVKTDFNTKLLRLHKYEAFLDALCEGREFQIEAIKIVCRFLAGGVYSSTRQLAEENYKDNILLAERYGSLDGLLQALPFPNKLSCSVDHATATGKSYVMYGIARILLAEGVVDRVVVLCPSLTIEAGLTVKFKGLSADARLLALIPDDVQFRVPDIKDAHSTTGPGDICVENIAATYAHVKSSVRDSFLGKGGTTLVLSDEAHHIYTPIAQADRAIKKWKAFLDDERFGFERIVGFSGTSYIGNDYFADVVHRYSLRQAMDDSRVKQVRYVDKDESLNQEERFQKYLELHRQNRKRYPTKKPLSILVTSKISGAETLRDEFVLFLTKAEKLPVDDAEGKVLIVTSKPEHKTNLVKLASVDNAKNPAEWIFSVSMLTEGWDVRNVFQVVPHEKRAFQSKLLIAQVLGRGLRWTADVSTQVVSVFNHSNWSSEIKNLVDEVLEQERRLHSYPAQEGEHAKYHFDLHQLMYETETKSLDLKSKDGNGHVNLFTRGYVQFETQPATLERITTFVSAQTGAETKLKTTVHYEAYTVEEVVKHLHARLKSVDLDEGSRYAKIYPPRILRQVVESSLERIGDHQRGLVSDVNLQRLYRAMGNIKRPVAKMVRIEQKLKNLLKISTSAMGRRSVSLMSFEKEATVFYDNESLDLGEDGDTTALKEITNEDSSYPKRASKKIANKFDFRSPVNLVLATHEPERRFLQRLFDTEVAEKLAAWVKSPDTGFYEISYSWRKGDHTKQGRFNPDLFLKLSSSKDVLVIELKDDGDDSDENCAKLRFATEHFERVNSTQDEAMYHVKFISPTSYDAFFDAIKQDKVVQFVSSLQATLGSSSNGESA
jgi:type III restriction enzyme